MPLESGSSDAVVSRNISELHTGKTFKKTKKKFGAKKAHKQSIAIAMSKAREIPSAAHNPPKPHHATEQFGKVKPQPRAAHTSELVKHAPATHKESFGKLKTKAEASHTSELVHHANHRAYKAVPQHLRGRGMISEKALAIMGKKLAGEAQPPHGHIKQAMAKAPQGKHGAKAAKPWKGQKLPGWASPEHGKRDAAQAHSDVE